MNQASGFINDLNSIVTWNDGISEHTSSNIGDMSANDLVLSIFLKRLH